MKLCGLAGTNRVVFILLNYCKGISDWSKRWFC